jgi:hypothetical protein
MQSISRHASSDQACSLPGPAHACVLIAFYLSVRSEGIEAVTHSLKVMVPASNTYSRQYTGNPVRCGSHWQDGVQDSGTHSCGILPAPGRTGTWQDEPPVKRLRQEFLSIYTVAPRILPTALVLPCHLPTGSCISRENDQCVAPDR